MKQRRELCPYANGITEDLKRGIVSGYCYVTHKKCHLGIHQNIYGSCNTCREVASE